MSTTFRPSVSAGGLSLAAPMGGGRTPVRVLSAWLPSTRRLAERCLGGLGYLVQPIRVSSSAELAPLLGLSEVIVDIVDSGRTLRENGLEEVRTLCPVEAHLIAGRRSYRFLQDRWWE